MMPGARGPRPFGLGPLFVVYCATLVGFVGALFVVDWVKPEVDAPTTEVDFATTEELERAMRYALAQLPRSGSRRESAGDRRAREVIEAGLEGQVVIVERPPPVAAPPTTTTTAPTTTSTTTTVPARPFTIPDLEGELVDDLLGGGTDGPP